METNFLLIVLLFLLAYLIFKIIKSFIKWLIIILIILGLVYLKFGMDKPINEFKNYKTFSI